MPSIRLPRPTENITAATVVRWLKRPGELFSAGDPLIELEAEEALILVEARDGGSLGSTLVKPRQTVTVSTELARVASTSSPSATASESSPEKTVQDQPETTGVIPILMPQAGNTMEEGTVLAWLVKEGDPVEVGQIICEIETDKATMEYESPAAGRLARIVAQVNQPMAVKELIAVFADDDRAAEAFLAEHQSGSSSGLSSPRTDIDFLPTTRDTTALHSGSGGGGGTSTAVATAGGRIKASPAARRVSAELGVSLDSAGVGSGPGERILSTDVNRAAQQGTATVAAAPTEVRRRAMSRMRRAIGLNLQQSKQTIPHFYMRVTIDAAPLDSFFQQQRSVAYCTINDIVVSAVGRAIREFPAVRSQIVDGEMIEFPHANIGIAVGVDEGLVVPVALNVDILTLAQLAAVTKRLVENGRKGVVENIGKGNFTISNLGMFGVEEFSAIINPPESGILAVSAMRETVIVEDGAMRPGRVMTMTLSADHRVVDGLMAAKFLARLKQILENPTQELS